MEDSLDRTLALRAQHGDMDAFGELVRQHQIAVFNVCLRVLGERREAEDATQEAFIRAYERLHTFDSNRPFGPWMRRVAANLCLNRLAAKPPPTFTLDDERGEEQLITDDDPETTRAKTEQSEAVRAALLTLPPHYRAVIELRHFHDLSYDDIAAALRLPVSDVKSNLFRARQLLAKKLATLR